MWQNLLNFLQHWSSYLHEIIQLNVPTIRQNNLQYAEHMERVVVLTLDVKDSLFNRKP